MEYDRGASMLSTEATGYAFMEMRGEKSYYDSSNGFWWSYGWDGWSFSIDGGSTWKETPSLEIQVVEDGALDDYVGVFNGKEWSQVKGRLEFLDEDYAMAGWLGMDQFFYDLYDGVGYDGEPLRLTYQEVYDDGGDERSDRWDHLPSSGHETEDNDTTVASGNLIKVRLNVYGEHTDKRYARFTYLNPTSKLPGQYLNIVIQADDTGLSPVKEALGSDIVYGRYDHDGYSLEAFVEDLEEAQTALKKATITPFSIDNLIILNHGNEPGVFKLGKDTIRPDNFYAHGYDLTFTRLGAFMSDDAQIHHYGCLQAGLNINDENIREHDHDGTDHDRYNVGSVPNIAWEGRNMLATIAHITGATVFASSDLNTSSYNEGGQLQDERVNVFHGEDMCLEFGVNPSLTQVDAKEVFHNLSRTGAPLWNLEKWFPTAGPPRTYDSPVESSMQEIDGSRWPGWYELMKLGKLHYYLDDVYTGYESGGETYELLQATWERVLC